MFTLSEISSGYIVIEIHDQDVVFETLVHSGLFTRFKALKIVC